MVPVLTKNISPCVAVIFPVPEKGGALGVRWELLGHLSWYFWGLKIFLFGEKMISQLQNSKIVKDGQTSKQESTVASESRSEQPSGEVRPAGNLDGIANGKISNITKFNF